MTTITQSLTRVTSKTQAILFSALLGLSIVTFVGLTHASTVHDATHDLRHASGFPCH